MPVFGHGRRGLSEWFFLVWGVMSTLNASNTSIGGTAGHDELVADVYAQLRAMAAGYFSSQACGHTLQPTALVNEALMRMIRVERVSGEAKWTSPSHFLSVAAMAMRQILVDYARAKAALKRSAAGEIRVEADLIPARMELDILELNDAIDRLAHLDERGSKVVVMRFFAGLTIAQTASVLGVSEYTVESDWRAARAFLMRELGPSGRGAIA